MKDETVQEMTQEERLTAIAYQFVQLYERWSEDRQVAAKQGADIAEFVKLFAEQVENFEALETNVRKTLITSIQGAMTQSAKAVGDEIRRAANQTLEEVNQRLLMTVGRAEKAIDDTQRHAQSISWFAVMGLLVLPIITSLLIVWLLVRRFVVVGLRCLCLFGPALAGHGPGSETDAADNEEQENDTDNAHTAEDEQQGHAGLAL